MKKCILVISFFLFLAQFGQAQGDFDPNAETIKTDQMIFVYGNGMERAFIRYVAELTDKKKPTVCFVTTASADHPGVIQYLSELVKGLPLEPRFLKTFISSSPEQETFEELILGSDAIMVGGGNTLNMLGIWKAQGIDTLLRQAYDQGIILAGGSAGSLCWFEGGYTDSRPKELTLMDCLGYLKYSHSPHYNDQASRRPMYHQAILEGKLAPGYACDAGAGLLFVNGKMSKAVSLDKENNSYYVSLSKGKVIEKKLPSKILK